MSSRNVLSTLLAALLVSNASCACASALQGVDAGAHDHHQQTGQVLPGTDCSHLDCDNCEQTARALPGKDTAQSSSCKLGLDDIDWSAIDIKPMALDRIRGSTGPPPEPAAVLASTPVRRFDRQLK